MPSLFEIRSDVENRISANKPNADMDVTRASIISRLNNIRSLLFSEEMKSGAAVEVRPDWTELIECLPVLEAQTECGCNTCFKYHLEDALYPLSIRGDNGIISLSICGGDEIKATTYQAYRNITKSRIFSYGQDSTYWYRIGSRIYLVSPDVMLGDCKLELIYVPAIGAVVNCSSIEEKEKKYPIPEDLVEELVSRCVASYFLELLSTPDSTNDGSDDTVIPTSG